VKNKEIVMSIGVIATIPVQEGENEEFEAVFMDLAAQVLANEPGCRFYTLNRRKSDPQVYKILESYVDKAALEAHGKTDYFKAASAKLGGLVAGMPDVEYLDGIEG
jgi:quinol monooxygenase YgiN